MNDPSLTHSTDGSRWTAPATPGLSRARLLGCVVLAAVALIVVAATASAADAARFEAESMSYGTFAQPLTGTWAQANCSARACLRYDDNGTATKTLTTTSAADQIAVVARQGDKSTGRVRINVSVDGVTQTAQDVDSLDANKSMRRYEWNVNVPAGSHTIGVIGSDLGKHGDSLITDVVSLEYTPPANDCDVVLNPGADTVPETPAANTVYCLHGGVYTESDKRFSITNAGIQIKSYPGELAELRGQVRVGNAAAGFILGDPGAEWPDGDGLRINGSYAQIVSNGWESPTGGDDITTVNTVHWDPDGGGIYANNISNRDPGGDPDKAGICVLMSGGENPHDSTIDGNYIHHCGQANPRSNHEHCVYASGMIGGAVTDNLMYECADRGFQGYKHPYSVDVSGNLIAYDDHAGLHTNANAAKVDMHNNVSVFNASFNYYSGPAATGSGNLLRDNCFWEPDGTAGIRTDASVTASGNVTAKPLLDADWNTGVVTVTNPTCAAKLPADSRFRP